MRWLAIPDFSTRSGAAETDRHRPEEAARDAAKPLPDAARTPAEIPSAAALAADSMDRAPAGSTPPPTLSSASEVAPARSHALRSQGAAMAAAQVRRLARSFRKRAPFGWRRTVLLVVGLACLIYGVTSGWRGGPAKGKRDAADGLAGKKSVVAPEIHRMSRAPLRVEQPARQAAAESTQASRQTASGTTRAVTPSEQTTNTVAQAENPRPPSTAPAQPVADSRQQEATPAGRSAKTTRSGEDQLFSVPKLGAEPSPRRVEEAPDPSPPAGSEPEFPVIGAPDGSAISRARARTRAFSDPGQLDAAVAEPVGATDVRPSAQPQRARTTARSGNSPVVRRETIAERTWQGAVAPAGGGSRTDVASPITEYPQTDPSKYRDPEYVIPSTASRARGPSR